MSLQSLAKVHAGGDVGEDGGASASALKELQGLTISLLTGANANTTIALAAIRQEDTVVKALNNAAGTITDVTSTISINNTHATGQITLASVEVGDTVTVNGTVYTAIAQGSTPANYKQFALAGTNTLTAVNLAAAINAGEKSKPVVKVVATASTAYVNLVSRLDGTAGNALVLVSSNGTRLAVTGSGTLTGGTATGGIKSTSATDQIILFWFNKR